MTVIIHPKKYLTFEQLKDRWKCSDDDIKYLIINEWIAPSIIPYGKPTVIDWEENEDGVHWSPIRLQDEEGDYIKLDKAEWVYLHLPRAETAHHCEFLYAANGNDKTDPFATISAPLQTWYQLEEEISIADVLNNGAVMMTEIERYESGRKKAIAKSEAKDRKNEPSDLTPEKELSTRERTSLIKILVGIAIKKYGFKPGEPRTGIAPRISDDLMEVGIKVDHGTIKKYLDEAVSRGLDRAN